MHSCACHIYSKSQCLCVIPHIFNVYHVINICEIWYEWNSIVIYFEQLCMYVCGWVFSFLQSVITFFEV